MAIAGASEGQILLVTPPASYRTHAYLEAASNLNLPVRIASVGEHALVSGRFGGLQVPLEDATEAVRVILSDPLAARSAAVIGTDDGTVELASRVAAELKLKHNPPGAARASRRKDLARRRLAAAGCQVPTFTILDLRRPLAPQLSGLSYPLVLKPVSLSGSRGVIRVDDADQARHAIDVIARIIEFLPAAQERTLILAEQYVPGPEIAVEALLSDGDVHVLAIFDKPDPLAGPLFEETIYVTPSRHSDALLARVTAELSKACRAYGLRHGPLHAELRLGFGLPWLLEVAARTIGGDCARLFKFGTGLSLEELVLLNALGRSRDLPRIQGAAGVMMLPTPAAGVLRRVEGVFDAMKVPGIRDVVISVREGYELKPLPEGSSYLGFLFATGDTSAGVERSLREAHERLRIVVAPKFKLEVGSVA